MNEPNPAEVEQYRSLWTTETADYVLVRDNDNASLLVVNISRKYPEAKLFSDDRLADAVTDRMLQAGVSVVTWDALNVAAARKRGES